VLRRNGIATGGTPHANRWTPCVLALLLLVASAWWCAIRIQARSSHTWVEVHARPRATCYQGQPRREVAQVQLWPGGPGVRLVQERQIHLPALEGPP
jgi:hypothetical protein